jgi:hypothetical protein
MDMEQSTFGLSRAKIARLMQIGGQKGQTEHGSLPPEDPGELLRDQLAQPFALDRDFSRAIPVSPKTLRSLATGEPKGTVGDVLRGPNTTASAFGRLKEFGRKLFSEGITPAQRDVGLTIYYGAIAGALVRHDVRITRLSYRELDQSLAVLVDKWWMPAELKTLFREACQICESLQPHRSRTSGE